MHEYGLAEGVLATVRQRAGGRKVAGIRVRFGVRHAVDSESMEQAFGFVAEGTEAAGARVELVTVPSRFEAEVLVSKLQANGIEATARHDDGGGWAPHIGFLTAHGVTFERV